jgi:hypothetical protein
MDARLARLRNRLRVSRDVADGGATTLPAVSIVDPDFETYSEENPQDITKGRVLRGRGHQPGHERPGLAAHAADLVL